MPTHSTSPSCPQSLVGSDEELDNRAAGLQVLPLPSTSSAAATTATGSGLHSSSKSPFQAAAISTTPTSTSPTSPKPNTPPHSPHPQLNSSSALSSAPSFGGQRYPHPSATTQAEAAKAVTILHNPTFCPDQLDIPTSALQPRQLFSSQQSTPAEDSDSDSGICDSLTDTNMFVARDRQPISKLTPSSMVVLKRDMVGITLELTRSCKNPDTILTLLLQAAGQQFQAHSEVAERYFLKILSRGVQRYSPGVKLDVTTPSMDIPPEALAEKLQQALLVDSDSSSSSGSGSDSSDDDWERTSRTRMPEYAPIKLKTGALVPVFAWLHHVFFKMLSKYLPARDADLVDAFRARKFRAVHKHESLSAFFEEMKEGAYMICPPRAIAECLQVTLLNLGQPLDFKTRAQLTRKPARWTFKYLKSKATMVYDQVQDLAVNLHGRALVIRHDQPDRRNNNTSDTRHPNSRPRTTAAAAVVEEDSAPTAAAGATIPPPSAQSKTATSGGGGRQGRGGRTGQRGGRGGRSQHPRGCWHCKKEDHMLRDCPALTPDERQQRYQDLAKQRQARDTPTTALAPVAFTAAINHYDEELDDYGYAFSYNPYAMVSAVGPDSDIVPATEDDHIILSGDGHHPVDSPHSPPLQQLTSQLMAAPSTSRSVNPAALAACRHGREEDPRITYAVRRLSIMVEFLEAQLPGASTRLCKSQVVQVLDVLTGRSPPPQVARSIFTLQEGVHDNSYDLARFCSSAPDTTVLMQPIPQAAFPEPTREDLPDLIYSSSVSDDEPPDLVDPLEGYASDPVHPMSADTNSPVTVGSPSTDVGPMLEEDWRAVGGAVTASDQGAEPPPLTDSTDEEDHIS